MATMKTRIINHLNTLINYYTDLAACEATNTRLAQLGAPQQLIDNNISRQAEMREELPRMRDFIKNNISHHTSLTNTITACGAAGFSPEALYAIEPKEERV